MTNTHETVSVAAGLADEYTPMQEQEALALLDRHYHLSGTLKRFATEKDDTFRLTTEQGVHFVLKIANPGESFGEIDFQHCILKEVEKKDPGIPVPRVSPNSDGADLFPIEDGIGQKRFVRLLAYLDGTPLCETSSNSAQRMEIGKILARLRHATAGVSHAFEDRILAWDVQHLLSLKHLLADVENLNHREKLTEGFERFRTLEPRVARCRRQVLHNDFSRSNIVVDHNDPAFVKGIIDFGDAVKTTVAIDVSTALLNQLPQHPEQDLFADGRDVLQGYLTVAELTQEELSLIPHLVMARVVARALISLWRAKMFPENQTYILRNTEQGWHQLDWFLSRSIEQVSATLLNTSERV